MFVHTNKAIRKEGHRSEAQNEENSHEPHEPHDSSSPRSPSDPLCSLLKLRGEREEGLIELVDNRLERLRHVLDVVIETNKLRLSLPNAVKLHSTLSLASTCRSVLLKSSSSIWKATGSSLDCLKWMLKGNARCIEFTARSHCLYRSNLCEGNLSDRSKRICNRVTYFGDRFHRLPRDCVRFLLDSLGNDALQKVGQVSTPQKVETWKLISDFVVNHDRRQGAEFIGVQHAVMVRIEILVP